LWCQLIPVSSGIGSGVGSVPGIGTALAISLGLSEGDEEEDSLGGRKDVIDMLKKVMISLFCLRLELTIHVCRLFVVHA
jgi:hypothetical protein